MAATAMAAQTQYRRRVSTVVSVVVHAGLLAVLAATSIRIASED